VKDSQSDEPDNGATNKSSSSNGLMNVSNGRLVGSDLKNGYHVGIGKLKSYKHLILL
jgi:hypothetical protein